MPLYPPFAINSLTGAGTGVLTALAVNVGSAGAFVTFNGAGGTPSALALANATGLPLTTGVTGVLPLANGGNSTALAYSGYRSTTQGVTEAWTKVQLDTETSDPNGWFDNATNYRFLPNVSGVYLVVGQLNMNYAADYYGVAIYLNGASLNKYILKSSLTSDAQLSIPAIVVLNGSTDYIELFGYATGASPAFAGGARVSCLDIYKLS